jgi:hypothetical protein
MSEQRQTGDSDTARILRHTFGVAPRSARAFGVPDVGRLSDGERDRLVEVGEGMAAALRDVVCRDCRCEMCTAARAALARWDELQSELPREGCQ